MYYKECTQTQINLELVWIKGFFFSIPSFGGKKFPKKMELALFRYFFILFFFFLLASYQRQSTSHLQSLIVIFFMQGSERVLHYASFQLIIYQWGREGHIQLCFLALSGNYLKFWDFKILVKCSFSSNPRAFIFPFWIFMDNLLVSLKNIRTYFFY